MRFLVILAPVLVCFEEVGFETNGSEVAQDEEPLKRSKRGPIAVLLASLGTFAGMGAAIVASARECNKGQYYEDEVIIKCHACTPGHYCPGNDKQESCPEGTYNGAYGAYSKSFCKPCNFTARTIESKKRCPPGTAKMPCNPDDHSKNRWDWEKECW